MIELGRKAAEQIPFWMSISKEVVRNKKWVKPINKMTIGQINHMIGDGKITCGTCDTMLDLTLPKDFKELQQIISHIINPCTLMCCDKCMLDDFDNGRVLGAEEGFLDEIKQIRQNTDKEKGSEGIKS